MSTTKSTTGEKPLGQLIQENRLTYFLIQMTILTVAVVLITLPAQFFLNNQLKAILIAAAVFDVARSMLTFTAGLDRKGPEGRRARWALQTHYWKSSPRRWFEYAILILPLNALLTMTFHGAEFGAMDNLATGFIDYAQSVLSLVIDEVSQLRGGLASLTVNFGIAAVLEHLAARWLFRKSSSNL